MSETEKKYSDDQDYCSDAEKFQSVPSYDETKQKLIDKGETPNDEAIRGKREEAPYPCPDDYSMGTIQDDKIYIATTDKQHERFAGKEPGEIPPADDETRLSGYFSDKATVDACKDGDTLDNTKYNQLNQIEPYQKDGTGDAGYKPHVDCFEIDRKALQDNYQTDDFNAAIAKCNANNQYGEGGGNQGYNPYINEMIENGTLKHRPEESYSDRNPDIPGRNKEEASKVKMNDKHIDNSVVPEDDYVDMKHNAETRAKDCVKNDTPHPSEEACKNGFPPNEHPVEGNTGNAKPINQKDNDNNTNGKKEPSPKTEEDKGKNPEIPAKGVDDKSGGENSGNVPNTKAEDKHQTKDGDVQAANGKKDPTPRTEEDKGKNTEVPTKAETDKSGGGNKETVPNTKAEDKNQTKDDPNTKNGKQGQENAVPPAAHTESPQNTNDGKQNTNVPNTNPQGPSSAPNDSGGKSSGEDIHR